MPTSARRTSHQAIRRGGVLPRPREGQSPSPTHRKIHFRRGGRLSPPLIPLVAKKKPRPAKTRVGAACQKSLAEFAARRRQRNEIIFSRDMCVRENTSRAASVEFVRHRRTNYARSRLQTFCRKNPEVFSTVSTHPIRGAFFSSKPTYLFIQ